MYDIVAYHSARTPADVDRPTRYVGHSPPLSPHNIIVTPPLNTLFHQALEVFSRKVITTKS